MMIAAVRLRAGRAEAPEVVRGVDDGRDRRGRRADARADDRGAIVVAARTLAFFAAVPRAAWLALAWRFDLVVESFGAHGAGCEEHGNWSP